MTQALKLGRCVVTRVEERLGPAVPPNILLPGLTPELLAEHRDCLTSRQRDPQSGLFVISIHSWLLRTPTHTILIDACAGNDKERLRPESAEFHRQRLPWIERLATAGARPQDIDYVLCTHLHVDHVGWNTQLADGRWVPTFPNARYLFARCDFEFWQERARGGGGAHANDGVFEDSVLPIVEAGQADLVDPDHAPLPELRIVAAPGHTPGHVMVQLASAGQRAVFSGDVMHHVLQVRLPQLNSVFCEDGTAARRTRAKLLDDCCEQDVLLLPAHFGAPHVGYVVRRGSGHDFRFVDA